MTNTNGRILPQVHVIRYTATPRPDVQGFADVEIDGVLRLHGLNLMRDGSLKAGQLTPLIHGKRAFIPAVEILDPGLLESLRVAIQAAIRTHLETLPPEQRMKPPRPPEPRQPDKRPGTVAASAKPAPVHAKPAPTVSAKPPAEKPKLPPPGRLLANFPPRRMP